MSIEQPNQNQNYQSEKITIKSKANVLKNKVKSAALKTGLAVGIGASAVGGLKYMERNMYPDYSSLDTLEHAFKQAKKDEKGGMWYKGQYYTTEQLEKKFKTNLENK